MREKNVHPLSESKSSTPDPLSELIRNGAKELLARALEAELEAFRDKFDTIDGGRRRLVRNGYHPERTIQTGIGDVDVKAPRLRDRNGGQIQFGSALLPRYLRKTKSIEVLLPWLYLRGISTGDMSQALEALLGPGASGLSSSTISRLKQSWSDEYGQWSRRRFDGKRFVYLWVDGIHARVRIGQEKQCMLVVMGATEDGTKELIAIEGGFRESTESWLSVLRDLKRRGLDTAPKVAVGDGALGFWNALREVYPTTRRQRCWVHKTANVLNQLPKRLQPEAKSDLHQISMAQTRKDAEEAIDRFATKYGDKYPKAVDRISKDRDDLLTFYDFPAAHWPSLRTTNPIESTFATIRLRTAKTRGCLSRQTMLMMVFKLAQSAEKNWRRLRGYQHMAKIVAGITYIDGIETDRIAA